MLMSHPAEEKEKHWIHLTISRKDIRDEQVERMEMKRKS